MAANILCVKRQPALTVAFLKATDSTAREISSAPDGRKHACSRSILTKCSMEYASYARETPAASPSWHLAIGSTVEPPESRHTHRDRWCDIGTPRRKHSLTVFAFMTRTSACLDEVTKRERDKMPGATSRGDSKIMSYADILEAQCQNRL